MTLTPPDVDSTLAGVRESSRRFAALLKATGDPSPTAVGHWSVGETAAHVTHVYSMIPRLLEGRTSPVSDHRQMSGTWHRLLADDPERDMSVLAERIETSTTEFFDRLDRSEWTKEISWHGGIKAPVYTLASILVNEAEIHGYDITGAVGKPWTIPQDRARLALKGLYPVLPHFVNPAEAKGLRANFAIDLRDGNPDYMLVHDGVLKVTGEKPARVHCRISAQPVEYALVGYGRISQAKPLLTGKILAFGRQPWLGFRFAKLLYSP